MKKALFWIMVIGLVVVLPTVVWAHTKDDPFRANLVTRRPIAVGEVLIWNDASDLYIQYVTANDWGLAQTHLHVAISLDDIPRTEEGRPRPWFFKYKSVTNPFVTEILYRIPLEWEVGTTLYVAAHAVVQSEFEKRNAWGEGQTFPPIVGCAPPENIWATYIIYTVQGETCKEGENPGISIKKYTNGEDANDTPGPIVYTGSPITWTYGVANTGDVSLSNVTVTDDKEPSVSCPKTELSVGEAMTCTASGTAIDGQYANMGTVVGRSPCGTEVKAEDPSHYLAHPPALRP